MSDAGMFSVRLDTELALKFKTYLQENGLQTPEVLRKLITEMLEPEPDESVERVEMVEVESPVFNEVKEKIAELDGKMQAIIALMGDLQTIVMESSSAPSEVRVAVEKKFGAVMEEMKKGFDGLKTMPKTDEPTMAELLEAHRKELVGQINGVFGKHLKAFTERTKPSLLERVATAVQTGAYVILIGFIISFASLGLGLKISSDAIERSCNEIMVPRLVGVIEAEGEKIRASQSVGDPARKTERK